MNWKLVMRTVTIKCTVRGSTLKIGVQSSLLKGLIVLKPWKLINHIILKKNLKKSDIIVRDSSMAFDPRAKLLPHYRHQMTMGNHYLGVQIF